MPKPFRHLPRRIGFGSGAFGATLDQQAGAIKLFSNEASGTVRDLVVATLAESDKGQKTEALKRETAEFELRLRRCKLGAEMGLSLPPPSECPVVAD